MTFSPTLGSLASISGGTQIVVDDAAGGRITATQLLAYMQLGLVFPPGGRPRPRIYAAGDYVLPRTMTFASTSGLAYSANTLYAFPFDFDMVADAIAFHTGTTGVAGNAVLGLYEADGEYAPGLGGLLPGTLIEACSPISTGGNNLLTAAPLAGDLDLSVYEGTWVAVSLSAAANLRPGTSSPGLASGAGVSQPNLLNANASSGVSVAYTYNGALPAVFPSGFVRYSTSAPPMIGVRAA